MNTEMKISVIKIERTVHFWLITANGKFRLNELFYHCPKDHVRATLLTCWSEWDTIKDYTDRSYIDAETIMEAFGAADEDEIQEAREALAIELDKKVREYEYARLSKICGNHNSRVLA